MRALVRRAATALLVGLLAGALLGLASYELFLRPSPPPTGRADAVVVLAGGGPRLQTGLGLADAGVARLVLVSDGGGAHWPAVEAACAAQRPYDIVCFTPVPPTTRGEAIALGAIARDRGLDRLLLVTVSYHARRAATLVERCVTGPVEVVGVEVTRDDRRLPRWLVREWGGLLHAWVVDRSC